MKQKHDLPLLFFIVMVCFNLAAGFAHPVTPTLIIERNLPSQWYGYAMSASFIGAFLITPFWGKLCNYVKSRDLIIFGNLGYILGQTLMCTSYSGPQLLIGRLIGGSLSGATNIAILNHIMNVGTDDKRSQYLVYYATSGNVCNAAGYFIGGMLGTLSIEAAFIGQACVLLTGAVLAFFTLEDDTPYKLKPEGKLTVSEVNPFTAFKDAGKYMTPALIWFFVSYVLFEVGATGIDTSVNYYIKDIFHLGSQYNGTVKAAIAIGGLLCNVSITLWIMRRRTPESGLILVTGFTAILSIVIYLSTGNVLAFFIIFVVYSLGTIVFNPVNQNVIAKKVTPVSSNSLMAFHQAMRSLGNIIGSLLQARLYALSYSYSFMFCSLMMILATVTAFIYRSSSRKENI